MKEYKFLVISMFIFSALLLLWTDYNNKQTAKMLKESRIEAEERLRIAKEKNQQKDSTSIDIDSTFNNID
ncbi:MAG: hypothetical protein ACJ0PK_05630 [Flavobacteriaceae bacterium]|tara:strand:- start:155 stop:364 length:210 start_codon:yes stop_codon:yes gene_type:complete